MNKIIVLSKDILSNTTTLSRKFTRGVVELNRERSPINGLTIYEALDGNVLIPNLIDDYISVVIGDETFIFPRSNFIDVFDIDQIRKCNKIELEIIKKYHIEKENYELLSKI